MAERRMFAKSVVQSDAFGEMPLTAQALYFHIGMEADDDGFFDNAQRLVRSVGASVDDMRLLITKGFILDTGDGVFVIRDWKISNYLRSDRYKSTRHTDKAALLCMEKGQPYRFASSQFPPSLTGCAASGVPVGIPVGIPHGSQVVSIGKDRIGEDRIGEDRISILSALPLESRAQNEDAEKMGKPVQKKRKQTQFVPPTVDDVAAYCKEKGYSIDAKMFHDYYSAADWHDSKGKPVLNWKQRVITWSNQEQKNQSKGVLNNGSFERDYSIIPDGISVI